MTYTTESNMNICLPGAMSKSEYLIILSYKKVCSNHWHITLLCLLSQFFFVSLTNGTDNYLVFQSHGRKVWMENSFCRIFVCWFKSTLYFDPKNWTKPIFWDFSTILVGAFHQNVLQKNGCLEIQSTLNHMYM